MSVFQQLNQKAGITIVLVTHEPDIAQYADRIVVVKDGLVREDSEVNDRRDAAAELQEQRI